ncbi:subtilisin family serine protease [Actinoplanes octamycinicus]|uniref:Subtilisin family serine protease n=1 Tax=Actinoplanes octamycinicus TaxID=135948 RepID=A0A7W7M5I0_9ACTN|nr:S8 family serine peptidase [Actinoplanes octamycinicus]MBB4737749.1 subtilisin family serine protease [Actinoplanes octamycinicus]GIE58050.1 serine protease [Actinoplanes octamycinicus]
MRRRLTVGAVVTLTGLAFLTTVPGSAQAEPTAVVDYTVVAADGVSASDAQAAIKAAGGTVVSANDAVGVYRVTSTDAKFETKATASPALIGASERKAIGYTPNGVEKVERGLTSRGGKGHGPAKADPLDDKLWGLAMVRADKARKIESGDKSVTVGVMDTGLDASNPDLGANFNTRLSRNFAPDIPAIDNEFIDGVDQGCEVPSCVDPVGTDDGGHGTHVAGTIGAALNGSGISGVAPGVSLVELKVGQDSGYFFLDPVVNALTYAADKGIDVVNMSFYVDPWLYNCTANPADSPEAQAEQQAIIAGMRRALNYAHARGVTMFGSLGNNHEDNGKPRTDTSSPDYGGTPYSRPIDNATCWDLPVEGPHVIGVSAVGPSGKKADYSNYGLEQISVAAPGGYARDGFGTDTYNTLGNRILSSYPRKVLQEEGLVDEAGNITADGEGSVFKDCTKAGKCGYYTYLQGTSMASPHAAGVGALIVSRYGLPDLRRGGKTLLPALVEQILYRSAAEQSCPTPRLQSYAQEGRSAEYDALCEGGKNFNGFYGYGIVDAYAAVGGR